MTWKELTTILTEVLAEGNMTKKEVSSVMKAWNARKKEITPMLKATKKRKDPNAPTKPRSAYILFCNDERANVVRDNPDISATDVLKKLGQRWRQLSDKDKAHYHEGYAKDRERYAREMNGASSSSSAPSPPTTNGTTTKSRGTSTRVKKTAGYKRFVKEQRADVFDDHPEWSDRRLTTELNKMWRALDSSARQDYERA